MRVAVKPLLLLHLPNFRPTKNKPNICPTFQNSYSFPINTPFQTLTKTLTRGISMAASPPPAVPVRDKIELTDVEKKIFDRLRGTVRHFGLQNQLRVAGGWVRDKVGNSLLLCFLFGFFCLVEIYVRVFALQLLGKDCYDIDIALEDMMGSEFVDKVREYLLSVGEEPQGIAVIPRFVLFFFFLK